MHGVRVVASPEALDRARWNPEEITEVWRLAPDEAFGWRAASPASVEIDDPDAIVEVENAFVGALLKPDDLARLEEHAEFALPAERPAIVQGKIAGVPVKLRLPDYPDGDVLLVQRAYADELLSRLR
jgi:hypothetical protein